MTNIFFTKHSKKLSFYALALLLSSTAVQAMESNSDFSAEIRTSIRKNSSALSRSEIIYCEDQDPLFGVIEPEGEKKARYIQKVKEIHDAFSGLSDEEKEWCKEQDFIRSNFVDSSEDEFFKKVRWVNFINSERQKAEELKKAKKLCRRSDGTFYTMNSLGLAVLPITVPLISRQMKNDIEESLKNLGVNFYYVPSAFSDRLGNISYHEDNIFLEEVIVNGEARHKMIRK